MVFPSLISRFAFLILLAVSLSESMMSILYQEKCLKKAGREKEEK